LKWLNCWNFHSVVSLLLLLLLSFSCSRPSTARWIEFKQIISSRVVLVKYLTERMNRERRIEFPFSSGIKKKWVKVDAIRPLSHRCLVFYWQYKRSIKKMFQGIAGTDAIRMERGGGGREMLSRG
jgi:hypothetical protein